MTHARSTVLTSLRSALFGAAAVAGLAGPASADFIKVTNLVTNNPAAHPGQITDPLLVNPWGISYAPTGPFWVSNEGTGTSTIYRVDPATHAPTKLGLTVTIPGDGSVTGQAFNTGAGSGDFNGNAFLFVNIDGTVSGWRGALGTAAEVLQAGSPGNVYTGTTMAQVGGNSYLYSANFAAGTIDVMKGNVAAPNLTGNFIDPTLPAGYVPFNVQVLGSSIYVAYALQGPGEEVPGPGLGHVSEFDTNGNFVQRVASQGALNAPWGMAIAPMDFGEFAGDLLIGNFGDGTINAYDLTTMAYEGVLRDMAGNPIVLEGLWGIIPGNGALGGSPGAIYFAAGPDDEENGIFGVLTFVPEPASIILLASALFGLGLRRRWSAAA